SQPRRHNRSPFANRSLREQQHRSRKAKQVRRRAIFAQAPQHKQLERSKINRRNNHQHGETSSHSPASREFPEIPPPPHPKARPEQPQIRRQRRSRHRHSQPV